MNTSGINPTGHMVVVKCDALATETPTGLQLPESYVKRENTSSQKGVLVAKGPTAGDYTEWPEGVNFPPEGSRVLIGKFAGMEVKGSDGAEYRVCEDKDVKATLEG